MSFIEKQVAKFGTVVDKSSSPAVVNPSNEEMINNMFRNLLGQKTFDRIKNRIFFLTPAEASKKWGGNFEDTSAAIMKRIDTKIQLDPRSPDGLSGFRERGKLDGKDEIVFIPRNMEAGTELATFFHEIGGHIGLDNILSPSEQTALVAKIKGWAKEYDNYISNGTQSGIDIFQLELMALEQGVLTSDEVVAGRAMARVKRLKTKGELKTPYTVNPNSPIN